MDDKLKEEWTEIASLDAAIRALEEKISSVHNAGAEEISACRVKHEEEISVLGEKYSAELSVILDQIGPELDALEKERRRLVLQRKKLARSAA